MEKVFISDLKDATEVKSAFSVKYKHPVKPYVNGFMFKVGLSDRSGEIEATFFGSSRKDDVERVYSSFKIDDVVFVQGYCKVHEGKKLINVNEGKGTIRKAVSGEYDLAHFVHVSNQDIEKIFSYIKSRADSVKDNFLRRLLNLFFEDNLFVENFKKATAAMFKHHACVGGLMEHIWGVLKLLEAEAEVHPSLDRDLLIAGAILHDIGKIEEFQVSSNIKQSEKGMLIGHTMIGYEMVVDRIRRIEGFPEILRMKVLHMILSHHGELEYGASIEPAFPEAVALFMADYFDSQITQYILVKKKANTEDFRTFTKDLGGIYLK